MRIVFFGTSHFAAGVLSHLVQCATHEIVGVVTRPERPQGRSLRLSPSPVQQQANQILPSAPVFQPEKASTEEFAATLKNLRPDIFVVVAYGEIIKENLLRLPPMGCINIHASLLPKYRGAAPMQRCLMEGDAETGITIIEMVRAMDAGPMIEQQAIQVDENMTMGELEPLMLVTACSALDAALLAFQENRVVKVAQDESKVTFAAKITPDDEKIDWSQPARAIHNRIRALSPKPGAWCPVYLQGQEKRLKIKRSILRKELSGKPGHILSQDKKQLVIACGEGALQILEVQLEGKKVMNVGDFLRGSSSISFVF